MSLDVYLIQENKNKEIIKEIVIREDGQKKVISLEEWNARFPYDPIYVESDGEEVYWANITHNLNKMAGEAGLYDALWRPGENGIETADQLIETLSVGLRVLEGDRDRFEKFNPPNGWGNYDGLVEFTRKYLEAAMKYPDATVYASR